GVTETTGRELPGRAPGLHLSDAGRRQAEAAAARVVGLTARGNGSSNGASPKSDGKAKAPAAAVYSSPLERTQETAAPIAAALGVEVALDDGLLELDMGEWTGLPLATARKRKEWATIQRYPSSFRFPGGESFLDMQTRMVGTIERLRAAHPGGVVVVVSHADPIRALVAHAMGTHLDLFQRLVVSPCSLTGIAYGAEGPVVLTVNATDDGRAPVPT
ncbi:MAG TPA: histidine phosphatase family protein, partial [Actinomycetes bacterium]|nr:histidine phosphatase family protein [Actinomycetes bacterium]